MYVAQPSESQKIVLNIFTISVLDKPLYVYIEDKVQVQCNAITLNYIFNGLLQKWIVNDTFVVKNYGFNSLTAVCCQMN